MRTPHFRKSLLFLSFLILLCGCKKEKPQHEDDIGHEHVATLILHFNGNDLKKTFRFDAPEISDEPLTTTIEGLPAGKYNVEIEFRGRADNDISDQFFEALKDEHFVFFDLVGDARPFIKYADDDVIDSNGMKIGKKTLWTLRKGESGVIIHLRHNPNKKDPNAPSASALGGHDDIKAEFKVIVE